MSSSRRVIMAAFMHFCALLFKLLTSPLKLMEIVGIYSLYKRVFPFLVYKITASYNKKMRDKKKVLFSNLSEFAGPDGTLRILEIGCGSGANFEFYPSGCKVICTDPNPHFQSYLKKSIAANDQFEFEKFVVASGENLGAVSDSSVDAVVSTLVLCSVKNTKRVLEEAHRILKPGGALYFLEHVIADPSTWTYFFQHVFQPLWYYFGDGCQVTRATWKDLEASKFSDLRLSHIEAPLMFMIRPHIIGYAVKQM